MSRQFTGVAVVLELFAIAAPLLNQLVVDDAIATHDADLLSVLIIGFALLLVIQTAVGLARSWMVMLLGQSLSLQWASNVFAHLIKLPVEYFEKRHLGDVVSRFGSVGSIQKTLTTSVIEAVLDGSMSVAALGMMQPCSMKLSVHRPETIAVAQRVMDLQQGQVREVVRLQEGPVSLDLMATQPMP